jgi:hypothetical protein
MSARAARGKAIQHHHGNAAAPRGEPLTYCAIYNLRMRFSMCRSGDAHAPRERDFSTRGTRSIHGMRVTQGLRALHQVYAEGDWPRCSQFS